MEASTRERMEKRFDVCYLLAKEDMVFRKYPAICYLEAKHGVELGNSYQTKDSASVFIGYIALQQRNAFLSSFSKAHFFSYLIDGSTDAGNVEDEIFVLLRCHKDDSAEVIRCNARFFYVVVPKKADADGLIECLSTVLQEIGICSEVSKSNLLEAVGKPILVGGGTDGASVNVGEQNGMKGKLQKEIPWLFWAWCYGHCLELACKDALLSNVFKNILEMLLKLYSIYALVALCPTEIVGTAKLGEDNSSSVQPVPITSLECQWSKPRCCKDSKVEVSNVSFKEHVYDRQRKHELEPINDFDPRPHEYKGTVSQKLQCFLEAMKGKDLGVSVMFDENLQIWEEDAEAPEPDKFDLPSNSDLIERVKKFKSTLTVTPERIRQIEKETIDQDQSSLWYAVRRYRLAASTFGRIYYM